jgi:hypothetical protein
MVPVDTELAVPEVVSDDQEDVGRAAGRSGCPRHRPGAAGGESEAGEHGDDRRLHSFAP